MAHTRVPDAAAAQAAADFEVASQQFAQERRKWLADRLAMQARLDAVEHEATLAVSRGSEAAKRIKALTADVARLQAELAAADDAAVRDDARIKGLEAQLAERETNDEMRRQHERLVSARDAQLNDLAAELTAERSKNAELRRQNERLPDLDAQLAEMAERHRAAAIKHDEQLSDVISTLGAERVRNLELHRQNERLSDLDVQLVEMAERHRAAAIEHDEQLREVVSTLGAERVRNLELHRQNEELRDAFRAITGELTQLDAISGPDDDESRTAAAVASVRKLAGQAYAARITIDRMSERQAAMSEELAQARLVLGNSRYLKARELLKGLFGRRR